MRLTSMARGGGCACKIPPGELETVVGDLLGTPTGDPAFELLVGLDSGDDAAAVRIDGNRAVISTTDFFTPVVDNPYDWGRIAAPTRCPTSTPWWARRCVALNLLCWPRELLGLDVAAEVLRGGADTCREACCHLGGGHSIDGPEPTYGLAVTGLADPQRLLRNDRGRAGVPLTLTKPLGVGVLNNRHKSTGERFEQAVSSMATLNAAASTAALAAGAPVRPT
jgi:selenide,water dikinase